jgi:membrane-associated phospholipid phosphatase
VPKVFYIINAASKWLVSIAVTAGVLWNPKSFRGPFIAVGSIGATVLASKLKRLVNQGRPEGAPFTDPGMPSSHALISFFVACSWGQQIGEHRAMGAALVVSALRVVCGYHTTPQIAVGGLLGALLGYAWMNLGALLEARYTEAILIASWVAYMFGSVIYIRKEVVRWFTDEKLL